VAGERRWIGKRKEEIRIGSRRRSSEGLGKKRSESWMMSLAMGTGAEKGCK
jgi:hypothetical protein